METISPYKKENQVLNLAFGFALEIIEYTEELEARKRFNMANQLFKCGTSIHANIREAQNAESKADFIHKMKIAAKEAEETRYWITLCVKADSYAEPTGLIDKLQTIIKILNKIIVTSKQVKTQ